MKTTRTNEDFNKLQESYSKGYFELYKKYFKEKEKIRKALEFIFIKGSYDPEIEGFCDDINYDELLELKLILEGNDNGQERNKE